MKKLSIILCVVIVLITAIFALGACDEIIGGNICDCPDPSLKYIDGNLYSESPDGLTLIRYTREKEETSFTIPSGVTDIAYEAFKECNNLTNVEIGNSVTDIGSSAFRDCDSLTIIVISESVTSIGDYAFSSCDSLTSIIVDNNNPYYKSIDGNLYNKDGLTLIQYAIGKQTTSFIIPSCVTSIGDYAFYDCSNMTSVEMPDSVANIGFRAFYFCDSLTSILIGKDLRSIKCWVFGMCDSLTSIIVDNNNLYYKSIDGNLYSKDGLTLIQYAIGKQTTSFIIPSGVTSIGEYAFFGCDSLTSVDISESVTSIGRSAFDDCDSFTSVDIPESVTSIGSFAFSACDSLTSIVIPDSVTSIGMHSFYACYNLTIYCEATSKPSGWVISWNQLDSEYVNDLRVSVVWGYTEE